VVTSLQPAALHEVGLAPALRSQVESFRAEGWEIGYDEALGERRLPPKIETTLYRVVQEALTNVRKHALTTHVYIMLARRGEKVYLEVRDQGRGFDRSALPERNGRGERVGLCSIRERVALLGGEFRIHSQPGVGTSVAAEIPLPRAWGNGWRLCL
jgi:signal transduction histidine kinase